MGGSVLACPTLHVDACGCEGLFDAQGVPIGGAVTEPTAPATNNVHAPHCALPLKRFMLLPDEFSLFNVCRRPRSPTTCWPTGSCCRRCSTAPTSTHSWCQMWLAQRCAAHSRWGGHRVQPCRTLAALDRFNAVRTALYCLLCIAAVLAGAAKRCRAPRLFTLTAVTNHTCCCAVGCLLPQNIVALAAGFVEGLGYGACLLLLVLAVHVDPAARSCIAWLLWLSCTPYCGHNALPLLHAIHFVGPPLCRPQHARCHHSGGSGRHAPPG